MFKEMLSDERGNLSAARTFLCASLMFTGALIVFESTVWEVPGAAYTLLVSMGGGSPGKPIPGSSSRSRSFWDSEVYQRT